MSGSSQQMSDDDLDYLFPSEPDDDLDYLFPAEPDGNSTACASGTKNSWRYNTVGWVEWHDFLQTESPTRSCAFKI